MKGILVKVLLVVAAVMMVAAFSACAAKPTPTPTKAPATPTPTLAPTATPTARPGTPTPTPAATSTPVPGTPTPTPVPQVLKIGVMGPLSGVGTLMGRNLLQGVQLAVDEVNAAGGLTIGGVRYTISLSYADDKYTTTGGTEAANKLIYEDKVKFITNNTTSGSMAARDMANKEKVIILSGSTSDLLLRAKYPYMFRAILQTLNTMPRFMVWLSKNTQIKTIGIINPNDEAGWAATKTARDSATNVGFKVVAEEYYERGTTDFYSTLTKVLAKNPDAIDLGVMLETQFVLKQLYELGYKGYKYTSIFVPGAEGVAKAIGKEAIEGTLAYFVPVGYDSPTATEGEKKFGETYKAKFGGYPENWYAEFGYALWKLMLPKALTTAGTLDADKVADALANTTAESLVPGYNIGFTEGVWGIKREYMYPGKVGVVRNGKIDVLARYASGTVWEVWPDWPKPKLD